MLARAREHTVGRTGLIGTIGDTPLVRLERLFAESAIDVYAKLETFNPGGSIKDRAALSMLRGAMDRGLIKEGTVLIESSSGNLGIGLAQLCRYFGLRFICVVDPKTTAQNIQIISAWGAEIEMVEAPDAETGEYLPARIARVRELLARIPNSFWSNQYANPDNAAAHHGTMREIAAAFEGRGPDYLVCAVSSCGTLRGCAEYIRSHRLATKIIAVDAEGSIIFGGERGKRLLPGHGAARVPELFAPGLAHTVIKVSDRDCVIGCHRLLQAEAILAGASSGAAVSALLGVAKSLPPRSEVAVVLCDRGERYLDTVYSDSWVTKHFGDDVLKQNVPASVRRS
jgi:2,3-diaminopropionate biosynthesis protein SbnA